MGKPRTHRPGRRGVDPVRVLRIVPHRGGEAQRRQRARNIQDAVAVSSMTRGREHDPQRHADRQGPVQEGRRTDRQDRTYGKEVEPALGYGGVRERTQPARPRRVSTRASRGVRAREGGAREDRSGFRRARHRQERPGSGHRRGSRGRRGAGNMGPHMGVRRRAAVLSGAVVLRGTRD